MRPLECFRGFALKGPHAATRRAGFGGVTVNPPMFPADRMPTGQIVDWFSTGAHMWRHGCCRNWCQCQQHQQKAYKEKGGETAHNNTSMVSRPHLREADCFPRSVYVQCVEPHQSHKSRLTAHIRQYVRSTGGAYVPLWAGRNAFGARMLTNMLTPRFT
jgi:hypothetical protein